MPDTKSPAELATEDRYNQVRAQIEHEDNLVAQRLNWFLTSQSFLFTAYAIVGNGPPAGSPNGTSVHDLLMRVVPTVAIMAGSLILMSIIAGMMVMRDLRARFAAYEAQCLAAGLPPLQGTALTRMMGSFAPIVLPVLFILVWGMLVMRTR